MSAVGPEVVQTLGALVTATTFSVGFLATRIHRERGRALDRVARLEEHVAEAARQQDGMDAAWFDGQVVALEAASNDRLDRLAATLNVGLGIGIAGLAGWSGVQADVAWGGSHGLLLTAFVLTALTVVGVGTVDFSLARRDVKRRYEQTAVGQMYAADQLLMSAVRRKAQSSRLAEAREMAERAVRSSHGLYGPAWAVKAHAHLASLAQPSSRPDLLFAHTALERALALGPESAPMRAALAFVHEERGDFRCASANWIRALWIYYEANRPLAHSDETAHPTDTQERLSGRGGPRSPQRRSEGPYAWRFIPGHPRTLSAALERIPPQLAVASFTAHRLVSATGQREGYEKQAVDALIAWLDALLVPGVWQVADRQAAHLLEMDGAAPVLESLKLYRSDEGAVGAAKRAELARDRARAEELAELERSMEESRANMQALEEHWRAQDLERENRLTEMREHEDRRRRIARGEGSPDDHAAQKKRTQRTVFQALASTTPEAMKKARVEAEERENEWLAREADWERWSAENEQWEAEMNARLDRMHRIMTGRATEADLEMTGYLGAEGSPWPAPDWVDLCADSS